LFLYISYFFLQQLSSISRKKAKTLSSTLPSYSLYQKSNNNYIFIVNLDDNFLSLALVLVGVEGAASEGVEDRARLGLGEVEGEGEADPLPRPPEMSSGCESGRQSRS
jgi:hypothetical protein